MPTKKIMGLNEAQMTHLKLNGFKVHAISPPSNSAVIRGRRDYYKVGLLNGSMTMNYGTRKVAMKGNSLFFVNPNVAHEVISRSAKISGYACIFTESFFNGRERTEILKSSPLYNTDAWPVISLNDEQAVFITGIFKKMQDLNSSNYAYRNEIIKSCIELIIHQALHLQPEQHANQHANGTTRVAHLFLDLLERQFPIETPAEPLKLRTPHDFANRLAVHVNYLNRSVKQITGKPTSVHIADRIVTEARALLQYTDWSIADIAYSLGFEYPAYFNNYFKRITGTNPKAVRKAEV